MAICGAAITLTGLFLVVGPTVTTAGASSPPEPNIGHFVPASAQVTGVRQIHMTRSGPAQLVVAYQSAQTNADLLLVDAEEAADTDHDTVDRIVVGAHDHVLDLADFGTRFIEHRLADEAGFGKVLGGTQPAIECLLRDLHRAFGAVGRLLRKRKARHGNGERTRGHRAHDDFVHDLSSPIDFNRRANAKRPACVCPVTTSCGLASLDDDKTSDR